MNKEEKELRDMLSEWAGADNTNENREAIINQITNYIDKHRIVSVNVSDGEVCDSVTIDYSISCKPQAE